jgi:putative hemolysin
VSDTLLNIGLILLFIFIGGVFASTELALVSLRESQVEQLARQSRRGARVAKVHADPNRFLAAVQIGVTVAGFLSAAFGASTLADDLSPVLQDWGLSPGAADAVALVGITLVIAYLSIVLSELVAKRIALQRAERVALAVAPAIDRFSKLMTPVIWLLSASTNLVLRLLGFDPSQQREAISSDELRSLVATTPDLGREERALIEDVFAAGDRQLREVMVPRTEVAFIDADTPVFKAVRLLAEMPHSRYPVVDDSRDDVVGFVHVRDLFDPDVSNRSVRVGELARDVLMLPGTKKVLPALSEMRRDSQHLAIVVDEYGGTAGIVTLEDLVEEFVGEIRDEYDAEEDSANRPRRDVLDVDGLLNIEDFADEAGFELPDGPYETVAGYLVSVLGRLPRVGDHVDVIGHRLEVTALDGRRVDRLRVTPVAPAPHPGTAAKPEAATATPEAARATPDAAPATPEATRLEQ